MKRPNTTKDNDITTAKCRTTTAWPGDTTYAHGTVASTTKACAFFATIDQWGGDGNH